MMRALVIDDSRAMRSILRSFLRDLGYEVSEAANGREAIAALEKSGPVELALVDWNMPEMNGFEFVQAARKNPDWNSMRMIMCTTETEMSQVLKALEAGANEYIMKPFTKEIIQEKISILGMAA